VVAGNLSARWQDYNPAPLYPGMVTLPAQTIVMPDGGTRTAYVTLPADASGTAIAGQFPTIFEVTDYDAALGNVLGLIGAFVGGPDPYLVKHGYAWVAVDGRGTGNSTGVWDAWGSDTQGDYPVLLDWVTRQGWTNGSIGLTGVSDLAIQSLFLAEQGNAQVKAVFVTVPMGDAYRDTVGIGGEANVFFVSIWFALTDLTNLANPSILSSPSTALPLVLGNLSGAISQFEVPTFVEAALGDPRIVDDSSFWSVRSPIENTSAITVPTFIVGAVHDIFQRGEPLLYEQLKNRVTAKLLIEPGEHLGAALAANLTNYGLPASDHIELQWFDQYLKGENSGAAELPQVTQYFNGLDQYAVSTDWPVPTATPRRYYLHAGGSLDKHWPGPERPIAIPDLPLQGLCSLSTDQWSLGLLGLIPLPCYSQDDIVERFNAVYETAPMRSDLYIDGPIEADLWVSLTNVAGSLDVRVDDLDQSGTATPITNGLIDVRDRAVDARRSRTLAGQSIEPWHPYTQSASRPVVPRLPLYVPVEIFTTSAMIQAGHRLRIAIGTGNAPEGVATGLPGLLQLLPGTTTVYQDLFHPSSVVLPVVPASSLVPVPK
jgi:putative CocE/NonD family hydrolase